MDYPFLCSQVCAVAREAGAYIAAQREEFTFDKVEFKGVHDMVSYVDKSAERMIVERLSELLPGSGFITEEGTARHDGERYRWVIDPLDGTTNFIHGLPPYCVSIGLLDGVEIVLGVVYEVTLGEMFYAWKGSEAWLDGRPIKAAATDKLDNALVALGFSCSTKDIDGFLRQVEYFQLHSSGMRRLGSATADIVYVACGRFDAFAQVNLNAWDVTAGALIAERAGAMVTDYAGGGDYVFGRNIIVCAPRLYDEFAAALRSAE